MYLETAADHAPDAPPETTRRDAPIGLTAERLASVIAEAANARRLDVIDVARRALDRHHR